MRPRHPVKRIPSRRIQSYAVKQRVGRKIAAQAKGHVQAASVELLKRYVDSAERFGDKTESLTRRYSTWLAGCLAVMGFVLNSNMGPSATGSALAGIALAAMFFSALLVRSVRDNQIEEKAMWELVHEQERELPGQVYTRLHEKSSKDWRSYDYWGTVIIFNLFLLLYLYFWFRRLIVD